MHPGLLLLLVIISLGTSSAHVTTLKFHFKRVPREMGECEEQKLKINFQLADVDITRLSWTPEPGSSFRLSATIEDGELIAQLCAVEQIGWFYAWLVPLKYECQVPWIREEANARATSDGTMVTINVAQSSWTFARGNFAFMRSSDNRLGIFFRDGAPQIYVELHNADAVEFLVQEIWRALATGSN